MDNLTYSLSYNLALPTSRFLIGQHLNFCLLTSPTCYNSPRKCTLVNKRQGKKLGLQLSHRHPLRMVLANFEQVIQKEKGRMNRMK